MSSAIPDLRSLGTATWADPNWVIRTHEYRTGSLWLGRLEGTDPVGYGDDRHVCLVSGSRSGKGTSSIINNLCLWPGSIVVVDPKGENATATAARRGRGGPHCEGLGQDVYALDPFGAASIEESYRGRFNPLDALDPDNEESIDEAGRLADALVVVHQDSKDPFWDESARALVKGLILHVLTAPEFQGRRNLITVRTLVTRGDYEVAEQLDATGETNPGGQHLLWRHIRTNQAFRGVIAGLGDTFFNMLQNSPKQFESVLQIANRNTEFLDSPAMQRCVEVSDFDLRELKTNPKGLSLYLCLPQRYMNTHYRWLRMMIALIVTEMEIVRGKPATGSPVLVILDEFAGLKRMEVIENAVAQIAGFGVKLFFVLQSLEQLKAVYKDNWETFLSNSGVKLFFGLDDHFSREHVSKLIGETELVRQVRSDSENTSESESQSHSESESYGDTRSRSRSTSGGTNTSVSFSESEGTNSSTSSSFGGSRSTNWREGLLWDRRLRNFSTGENWSTSHSDGTSKTTGTSRSEGANSGWSTSDTEGTSRTSGTTTGTTKGTTRGRTSSMAETMHKRALISPDEIGRWFARIDDRSSGAYPGLAIALVAGASPMLLRRVNYFQDPQFIRRFSPHPDHGFTAPIEVEVARKRLREYEKVWPTVALSAWRKKRGDVVWAGEPVATLTVDGGNVDLLSPRTGRFEPTAERPDGGGSEALGLYGQNVNEPLFTHEALFKVVCYQDGGNGVDPFREIEAAAQLELARQMARKKEDAERRAAGERELLRKLQSRFDAARLVAKGYAVMATLGFALAALFTIFNNSSLILLGAIFGGLSLWTIPRFQILSRATVALNQAHIERGLPARPSWKLLYNNDDPFNYLPVGDQVLFCVLMLVCGGIWFIFIHG